MAKSPSSSSGSSSATDKPTSGTAKKTTRTRKSATQNAQAEAVTPDTASGADTQTEAVDTTVHHKPSLLSVGFAVLMLLSAVAVALAVIFVFVAPKLKGEATGTTPEFTAAFLGDDELTSRVTQLEDQVQAMEKAGGAIALARIDGLSAAIEATRTAQAAQTPEGLEARVKTLENALAAMNLMTPKLEELSARVEQLETMAQSPARGPALILAVDALHQVSQKSDPFAQELKALKRLAPEVDTAALTELAEVGAPSRVELRAEFPAIATRAFEVARSPGQNADLLQKLGYGFSRIVSVRRTGPAVGNGPDAILARAEHRLNEGDLKAALAELDNLSGRAAEIVKPWKEGAEMRLKLDRAVQNIRSEIIAVTAGEQL